MKKFETKIGIQGGVMGWEDPFNPALSKKYMRTGERQQFKSQDVTPSVNEEMSFIKNIGADFYLHNIMPENEAAKQSIKSIDNEDIDYMINNEFGNINEICEPNTNRHDVPADYVKENSKFLGIVYDETEHMQLHPDIYFGNNKDNKEETRKPHYQWANPEGLDLKQIEDAVCNAVKETVSKYDGTPLFGEYVFPVMHHTLARGGMNPCPKILKEEFSSIQLATSLGAAMQYKRKLGICVDLWGQDVGNWFTRIWGFPAHSPKEFLSALKLAYLMAPDLMYVENIDTLALSTNEGIIKTEFGEAFESFTKDFIPNVQRPYHHSEFSPDVVIIRSDDTVWRENGNFNGSGPYGSFDLKSSYESTSVFQIFNLLSNGLIPSNGITTFLPQFEFPHGKYIRNEENLKKLPLLHGVPKQDETNVHKLFYPLNNLAVFDENVMLQNVCNPKIVFLTGSRVTQGCLESVYKACENGAKAVIGSWLVDNTNRINSKNILYTDDFSNNHVREMSNEYITRTHRYYMKFADTKLVIEDKGDGIDLDFRL